MDQPTAEEALKRLEPLVGEWTLEAKPPEGPPWPGEARSTIEWHDSGAHLVERSTAEMPEDLERPGRPFTGGSGGAHGWDLRRGDVSP